MTADDLRLLNLRVRDVNLSAVLDPYVSAVSKVRDLGVTLTDRRAVKVLKLVAASAVMCGRPDAVLSDLWVFRYVWDRAEQIGPLASLVTGMLKGVAEDRQHPQSIPSGRVDAEALAKELADAEREAVPGLKLLEAARLRERVQTIADRAAWVSDTTARDHLLRGAAQLVEKLG